MTLKGVTAVTVLCNVTPCSLIYVQICQWTHLPHVALSHHRRPTKHTQKCDELRTFCVNVCTVVTDRQERCDLLLTAVRPVPAITIHTGSTDCCVCYFQTLHVSIGNDRQTFFYKILKMKVEFKVCKSVHHRTIQINHQPDATNFPVYYPDVYLQLNMFRAFPRPSSGAQ